jgi:hypothetical protein
MRRVAIKKQCKPPLFFKGGTEKQKADWLTRLIATNLAQQYAGASRSPASCYAAAANCEPKRILDVNRHYTCRGSMSAYRLVTTVCQNCPWLGDKSQRHRQSTVKSEKLVGEWNSACPALKGSILSHWGVPDSY